MASAKKAAGPAKKKTTTKKKTTAKKTVTKKTVTKKTVTKKTVIDQPVSKGAKKLRIRQIKSGIGSPGRVRRTLIALGLRHHQAEATVPDNVSTQGMLRKVHHLVRVVGEEK